MFTKTAQGGVYDFQPLPTFCSSHFRHLTWFSCFFVFQCNVFLQWFSSFMAYITECACVFMIITRELSNYSAPPRMKLPQECPLKPGQHHISPVRSWQFSSIFWHLPFLCVWKCSHKMANNKCWEQGFVGALSNVEALKWCWICHLKIHSFPERVVTTLLCWSVTQTFQAT